MSHNSQSINNNISRRKNSKEVMSTQNSIYSGSQNNSQKSSESIDNHQIINNTDEQSPNDSNKQNSDNGWTDVTLKRQIKSNSRDQKRQSLFTDNETHYSPKPQMRNQQTHTNSRYSDSSKYSDSSEPEKYYTMREVVCNLRDAVVSISGQTVLTTKNGKETMHIQHGNGFFIKGHYIICPADVVLISPIILDKNKRNPIYFDDRKTLNKTNDNGIVFIDDYNPRSEKYVNSMIRVSKILIDVSNVNGLGKSYSYDAGIVGIDGAANIAVLYIDMNTEWNKTNPSIRICHPYLQWGKSRSSCPGDTIIIIGNISPPSNIGITNNILYYPGAENAVVIGNLADNRYVFPGGHVSGELLLLSNILCNGYQRGLPVMTVDGTIIGMIIYINETINNTVVKYDVALSEFFMRRPVKALIRSHIDNKISDNYKGFIQEVFDPIGNYYRFNKAWLGISGILMGQDDYNTIIEKTETLKYIRVPFLNGENSPKHKEIVGYRILSIISYEESLISNCQRSPLYNILSTGDIITHVNGCPLGDRKGQISPTLVMWRVRPGDTVTIQYKKQIENFENIYEILVCTDSYEPFMDFPFYSMNHKVLNGMSPILM